jgi:uncharacterized protein (UPF0332 family)
LSYEKFLKANLVKKVKPDYEQINMQLNRAVKDLKTAKANLNIDLTWSLTIAYHSMIRGGRALMYSKGYLPTFNQSHKTIVEFTRVVLGNEYTDIISKFNRLRRRRHNFIYESENHVTLHDAKSSIDVSRKLIDKIVDLIKKDNPQNFLF